MNDIVNRIFKMELESIRRLQSHIPSLPIQQTIDLILHCTGKVIVTGVGKSGHIASKIAATMASTGTPSFYIHPGEACHGDLGMIDDNDIILAISHSGETNELMTILPVCKQKGIQIICITSNPNSSMASIADIHLNTYVSEEAGLLNLAPTCSTTATLVLGDAIAIALAEIKNFSKNDFACRHPAGALGKRLTVLNENIMRKGCELPLVYPSNTISDVIFEISRKRLGFAIIVTQLTNELIGIFTDGDLRRLLSSNINLSDSIDDVAHTGCITVKPKQKAYESLEKMQKNSINALVVVDDDNHVVGAFNIHDLISIGF